MINAIILSTDLAAKAGGYTIAVVGWVIVFAALIGLVIIFKKQINQLLNNIFSEISKQSKEVY